MVCQIVDIIKDDTNFPCIIMEKCNRSLENIIKENPGQLLPEKYIVRIFTMICMTLYYIHKNGIVHRDLKPDNILQKFLGDKEIFSITDFGTSQNAKSQFKTTAKKIMTPLYASYEQLDEEDAHPSFDIWSLGINLYTLMARKEPYIEKSIDKMKKAIKNNKRD